MPITTMKIDTAVRERLAELAREHDMTQNSALEFLLDEHLWAQRLASARSAMRSASEADERSYQKETEYWDRSLTWPDDD